jgi:hypothetical protein
LYDTKHVVRLGQIRNADLLVCTQSVDPEKLRPFCKPGAKLFGYIGHDSVPLWGQGSPYWEAMRNHFDVEDWYYHARDGTRVEPAEMGGHIWTLRPHLDAVDARVDWIADRMTRWDGIYIDMMSRGSAPWTLRRYGVTSDDYQAESDAKAAAAEFMLRRLRWALPNTPLLINTWGPRHARIVPETLRPILWDDGVLELVDGITIEKPEVVDLPYFLRAARVIESKNREVVSVGWYRPLEIAGVLMPGEKVKR